MTPTTLPSTESGTPIHHSASSPMSWTSPMRMRFAMPSLVMKAGLPERSTISVTPRPGRLGAWWTSYLSTK